MENVEFENCPSYKIGRNKYEILMFKCLKRVKPKHKAWIGFMATAALHDEKGAHAAIGGVSTAMMILPIFVVHW